MSVALVAVLGLAGDGPASFAARSGSVPVRAAGAPPTSGAWLALAAGGASPTRSTAGGASPARSAADAGRPPGPSAGPTLTPDAPPTSDAGAGSTAMPSPGTKLPRDWLAQLPAYATHGSPGQRWIALTFDADMYPWMDARRARVPEVDMRIIDLLERTHTPATVFVNGLWAQAYPTAVRRLAADPDIELANHSWDHAGWTVPCPNTSPIGAPLTERTEVTRTAGIVERLTGVAPRFFRFPGGCHDARQTTLVRSLGEEPVGWTCAFGDTFGWSAARQVASVERGCRPGGIVITHLNGAPYHPNVLQALETLIPWWRAHGWRVVTVSTLLGLPPA